jgi:hypothetical protein
MPRFILRADDMAHARRDHGPVMRSSSVSALMLLVLACCGAAMVAGLALLLGIAKPVSAAAPSYGVVPLGGLQYEAMLGRSIDPADPVDAAIIRGLPAGERRSRPGEVLYGAFIAVANDSPRWLPAASRIELEDAGNHVYRPLRLPAGNPYAYYSPRSIPPRTRVPGYGSPADDNLAATGYLLLFRIPESVERTGTLELVIHDPGRPAHMAWLDI